jgi:plasmid stabilization system protein ParE
LKVFVQDSAYADLERIYRWIAHENPRAADRVVQTIGENMERLGVFPRIGHAGSTLGTLEWVIPRLPYIVVYKFDDDAGEVRVTAVFHAAQDRSANHEKGR